MPMVINRRKRLIRLVDDRRGAAAMELALLLPVLTTMICGLIQYGTLMFTYNAMLNSARNGSRAMAVGAATAADVVTNAKANLPGWVPAADWTVVAQDTITTGTNQVNTRISVASTKASVMNFPLVPMPTTLDVTIVMLKET